MNKELWTIGRMLQWSEQYFRGKGIESARLDGEVLLSHMLGVERIYVYAHFDQPLTAEELDRYRPMVIARGNGKSVAAITGTKDFMGLTFKVSEDVLIPRPDTETLVEEILNTYSKEEPISILDVCSGSGAILLSLLHYLPKAHGLGLEKSTAALKISEANLETLQLTERGAVAESDLFSFLEANPAKYTNYFNLIVSNPPYIPTSDINKLAIEVKNEPHMALDGGKDGLDFYRRILQEAKIWLKSEGVLAVEIGQGQESDVVAIAKAVGGYGAVKMFKDLGGIIRVLWWEKA